MRSTNRFTCFVNSALQRSAIVCVLAVATASTAQAAAFSFNTGNVDGRMAMASRPSSAGKIEIEAADDFLLGQETLINHATFTGLLTGADIADIGNVRVEIYRVFPKDSIDPPDGRVVTRVNSPSDNAFDLRDVASANLSFTVSSLNANFTAANSVLNGINAFPNQTTGGDGAVTGQEVLFDINFLSALDLPADHYFFVPQVELTKGQFYWLSSVRPIVAPGTPFAPDLQAWIRNELLAPDWSRVGTDIVGGPTPPTFNGAFSLDGTTVVEPNTVILLGGGMLALLGLRRRGSGTFA